MQNGQSDPGEGIRLYMPKSIWSHQIMQTPRAKHNLGHSHASPDIKSCYVQQHSGTTFSATAHKFSTRWDIQHPVTWEPIATGTCPNINASACHNLQTCCYSRAFFMRSSLYHCIFGSNFMNMWDSVSTTTHNNSDVLFSPVHGAWWITTRAWSVVKGPCLVWPWEPWLSHMLVALGFGQNLEVSPTSYSEFSELYTAWAWNLKYHAEIWTI